MNKQDIDLINNKLSVLRKKPLRYVNRGGGSIFMGFGELVEKNSAYFTKEGTATTRKKMVSKFALHMECSLRFTCGNDIIVAKSDMFLPSAITEKNPDFDWDNFDWDIKGNNKFDEIVNYYFSKEPLDFIVSSTEVSKFGDLKIIFENDFILEVFADVSGSEECWRFFEVGSEKHVVVSSQGLENDACEDS